MEVGQLACNLAQPMKPRVLLVDDEAQLLSAVKRQLGDVYDLTLALGPFEGLKAIGEDPEFEVIVADMRMPGMDGIEFLSRAREAAPNSIRMMLTGNADHQTAVSAVNEGNVFRFLNKPASRLALVTAIDDCHAQYRLVQAEKELLEKTLIGSIKVLVEILATVNPAQFGKAQSLKAEAAKMAEALNVREVWQIELAAMLCQIGSVALPSSQSRGDFTIVRLPDPDSKASSRLPKVERDMNERIPLLSASLINKIPRLDAIAEAVMYQDQRFDGTGFPGDGRQGRYLPMGARILKVLKDYGALIKSGKSPTNAINSMRAKVGWYDPIVLQVAAELFDGQARPPAGVPVAIADLAPGDVLGSDLVTSDGVLLAGAGQILSEVGFTRVSTFLGMRLLSGQDVVYVLRPVAEAA